MSTRKITSFTMLLSCAVPALAQSVPTEKNSVPVKSTVEERIVVTGSKLDLTLQKTVDSVELLTAERLEKDAVFDLSDAIGRTPNASVLGGDLNSINIRGISRNGTGGGRSR